MPPKDTRLRWEKERGWKHLELLPAPKTTAGRGSEYGEMIALICDGFKVEFYDGKGVLLCTPRVGNPSGKNGGVTQRGTIDDFTRKSRAAMRKELLTKRPREGRALAALTLTVPGPPLTVTEKGRVWKVWRNRVKRLDIGLQWRMELQRRGSVHWHALAAVPVERLRHIDRVDASDPLCSEMLDLCGPRFRRNRATGWIDQDEGWRERWDGWRDAGWVPVFAELLRAWNCALDSLGEVPVPVRDGVDRYINGRAVPNVCRRSEWRQHGATAIMLPEICEDREAGWLRYMQDHCTKSKREQVASGMGRHWGVINKEAFERVFPDEVADMSRGEYARFLRAFQRLTTPSRRCELAPFGRKLGYANKRGRIGTSVWFSRPETVRRLVNWAREDVKHV